MRDGPRQGWLDAIRDLRPDVVDGLLNWRAVPLAHEVLRAGRARRCPECDQPVLR